MDQIQEGQAFGNTRIARELAVRCGLDIQPITVEMKYVEETDRFVRTVEKAHRNAASSKLKFPRALPNMEEE